MGRRAPEGRPARNPAGFRCAGEDRGRREKGPTGRVPASAREGANGERAVRGMALARGPDVAVREKARARGLNGADRWGRQISGSVRVRGSRLELGGGS